MFEIIKLIAIAALVATVVGGAVAAWHSFTGRYIDQGKVAQKATDAPILAAAETAQKQAEADKETAKGNQARCEDGLKKQKDAQAETDRQTARNLAASKALLAEQARRDVASAAREADLKARAAAAPVIQACEKERDLAKATLRETLKARRGMPQPAAPAPVPK